MHLLTAPLDALRAAGMPPAEPDRVSEEDARALRDEIRATAA